MKPTTSSPSPAGADRQPGTPSLLRALLRPSLCAWLNGSDATPEAASFGASMLRLHEGESPFNAPLNRYPDEAQERLRQELSRLRGVRPDCILPTRGISDALDLLLRVVCLPGRDNVVTAWPTCADVARLAALADVECRRAPLSPDFSLQPEEVVRLCNAQTKVVLLSSPGDVSGQPLEAEAVLAVAELVQAFVVVNEAYVDYSERPSLLRHIATHPNIIVLQTFSKAWASAGLRLGMLIAVPEVVEVLGRLQPPHVIATPVAETALQMLRRRFDVEKWVKHTVEEREKVRRALRLLPFFEADYPSATNFLLVRFTDAAKIETYLRAQGICVKWVGHLPQCENCLRITIGAAHENSRLLSALRQYPGA